MILGFFLGIEELGLGMREGGKMGGEKEDIGLREGFLKGFFVEDEGKEEEGTGLGMTGVEGVERSLVNASIPLRAERAFWLSKFREAGLVDGEFGLGSGAAGG